VLEKIEGFDKLKKKDMKRIINWILLAGLAVIFVGTLVFLYNKSNQQPVVHEILTPQRMTIIKKTVATGKVIPRREIEVKAQVSGVVEKLYVEAGQTVKRGDIIAKIALRPNMINLNTAESQLMTAQINLKNQEADMKRYEQLRAQNLISEAEYNQFRTSYELQKEAVAAAEDAVLLLRTGASKHSAMVSNMVPATIDGMVLDLPNKEGAFIVETSTFQSGTTVAVLADMNDMIFEGLVDESEVGKLREGMELLLNVGALEDKPFKATLEFIAPKGVADQGAIKFTIRAAVQLDQELFLRSNYSANADIVLDRRDDVLAINEACLIIEDGATYVEVETAPQTFVRREIKTGLSDGIHIEVLEGLSETDRVRRR
jgi:HlyD family secretion protein